MSLEIDNLPIIQRYSIEKDLIILNIFADRN